MDLELYDEFGNYVGPELDDVDDVQSEHEFETQVPVIDNNISQLQGSDLIIENTSQPNQIVLHEDKKYYPSAEEVYGEEVETMVELEDQQPLSEPIIKPVKEALKFMSEKELPLTKYSKEYLVDLMPFPELSRMISIVGHLHHGKTSFMDMIVNDTHILNLDTEKELRYTDVHTLERERGISIKAMPITVLLESFKSKNYTMNFIDTPGHCNFSDEIDCAARISDGAVLIVDAIEGVMSGTENIIKNLILNKIPFFLVINKIDRLMLELKLPPQDCFFKLKHTIEEVNSIIDKLGGRRLSPCGGDVCFASTEIGFCFSLKSFAIKYAELQDAPFDVDSFVQRLWGDVYFDKEKRSFRKSPLQGQTHRTFTEFILEPLYKLIGQTISENKQTLKRSLATLGIYLKPFVFDLDVKPMLKHVCNAFFGDLKGFTDTCINIIPSPIESANFKTESIYTGDTTSKYSISMSSCDPNGPLMIQIVKLYNVTDVNTFDCFGRIMSGTIKVGQSVRVLGEGFSPEDDEDMTIQTVDGLAIFESRYKIPVKAAYAGNWILISGVEGSIIKSATITDLSIDESDPVCVFKPIRFGTIPVMKIAVEPINPTELPRMLDGLRKINKSYPILETKVEESGEHIIIGTGELYLDCVLHDLRKLYAEIDIKIADPVVRLCETVVEGSQIKCYAETPNKKNKITMICEPLEKGIAEDIENFRVSVKAPPKALGAFFIDNYDWDILASRNIWAFGPTDVSPNILINDTLPSEVFSKLYKTPKKLLFSIKDSIRQGFQWGTREGPLTDEPIRNVKFRIIGAEIANEPIYRGGGQIIPTARRVCYSSFLMASPRLMEPVYAVEIQAPADCIQAVYSVLARRRGHVTQDLPKPGSPLYTIKALLPALDSCGFETDLRTSTQGQAFCQQLFDHWQIVPGDPLDKSIILRPLEPSPAPHLARDLMIKTRRRKGLSEDVSITKFFDDPMIIELAQMQGQFTLL